MKTALQLPRMELTTIENHIKLEEAINLIREAKNVLLFIKDEAKQKFRFLYSALEEDEFLMLAILLLRNIELFNFVKLVILDIEKTRAIPCEEHDFTYRAIEYIKLGKLKNFNINI